ncbi:hypothetical protein Y032_0031g2297 [Ancylostoma ceylanicum]|uniref:Uncharacterized protein n=1 Tax=Ancylostoma ceylanicum TaxID=53326 RepID=A0A016URL4_9BILA|nr:hypothetical protein Y032_0031g2297 [Ancylostoma ceylanicum]
MGHLLVSSIVGCRVYLPSFGRTSRTRSCTWAEANDWLSLIKKLLHYRGCFIITVVRTEDEIHKNIPFCDCKGALEHGPGDRQFRDNQSSEIFNIVNRLS